MIALLKQSKESESLGLTSGFGSIGEVCTQHSHSEQGMGSRAMLVHLCSKCNPVLSSYGQNLQKVTTDDWRERSLYSQHYLDMNSLS